MSFEIDDPPKWASLRLVTRMEVLGDPQPMAVHDGYVHLGFWELSPLGDDARTSTSFYLVRVPLAFDLEHGSRLVRRATLELKLESSGARAHDLFPVEVDEKAEITFFVSPDYRFDRRAGERPGRRRALAVEPEIRGWGRGNPAFRWIFSTRGNIGVASGDRELYFVLAAPAALRRLEVEVKADIDIAREILGIWYEGSSDVGSQKLTVELISEGEAVPR